MKPDIVVVGAGGHAKVCIELLRAMKIEVAWCVAGSDAPGQCLNVPVLAGDDHMARLRAAGYGRLFVAIGANRLREKLAGMALELGYELVSAVSPHAIISPTARLGAGIAVMAGAIINANAVISDLAIINTGAVVDHDCQVGRAAHVGPQTALAGNVEVGDQVMLGVGCKAIPGVRIGAGAVVGAGAAVISDIPAGVTVVGVPARTLINRGENRG